MLRFNYIDFDCLDSTQKYAVRNIDLLPEFCVITAKQQTNGVGKFGSTWESPAGNLYASYILPDEDLDNSILIQCATVAAVVLLPYGCKIKWLNDIILNNKKVGGIICDRVGKLDGKKYMIFGVGINLVETPISSSSSILKETGEYLSPLTISRQYGQSLMFTLKNKTNITKIFDEYLAYKGSMVECIFDGGTSAGRVRGVSENGELCILTDQGVKSYKKCKINILTEPMI